ncbi:MAG: ABC-2 type transport system permease protein [Candidatus Krumholzibacteriia bacterium]|jgi:ABC-2 type transport system permease protein
MNKILTVIRREYLERVRSKSFVVGTVLGPALMSMVIILPMLLAETGGDDERTIGIIDPSGLYYEELVSVLADQGRTSLEIERVTGDPEEAIATLQAAILDESIHSGVFVDPDFLNNAKATFYNKSVSAGIMRDEMLRPALNRVLREGRFAQSQVPDSLFNFLAGRTQFSSITVTEEGGEEAGDGDARIVMAFSLIMMLYIMVLTYGSHTLTAVIEEKSSKMVEVLLASISPSDLMLGKVLGIGLAGFTQFAIWSGTFFFISQKGVSIGDFSLDVTFLTPLILVSFMLFFILGFFLYATIYAGIGAMCNTVQDSQQFNIVVAMGMIIPMMLLTVIIRSPDSTVAMVLSLIPMFSPVLMFMRVCVETPPMWQIGLSYVLMILSIWLASKGAGKLFRMGILMSGESPTWATMYKVLRD